MVEEVKHINKQIIDLSEIIEKYFRHYDDTARKQFLKNLEMQIRQDLKGLSDFLCVAGFILSALCLVAVFFGYKLYRSLVDREKRKEEKKRQKLQKKKK